MVSRAINIFALATLCSGLLLPLQAVAEIAVIANPDMPVTSMSREEINRIYLGKMKFLPSGAKVTPVDQRPGASARSQFYANVMRKSETQMKSYWSRVIFTGQGQPPLQETDDQAVKSFVAKNPSGLGYIDKSAVDDSVKVVYSAN